MSEENSSLNQGNDDSKLPSTIENPKTSQPSSLNQAISSVSPAIREDLVTTAVKFLLNPKVIHYSLINKRTFLLKKGLTSDEIDVAIEKSLSHPSFYSNSISNQLAFHQSTFWQTTRSIVSPLAFISVAVYGSYFFYKKFLEPRFFKPKPEPIDQIHNEIETLVSTVKNLEKSLQAMEIEFQSNIERFLISSSRPNPVECAAINDLKTEISSIKSLLLNKDQFPLTLSNRSSIPSWQLCDQPDEVNNSDVLEKETAE